MENQCERVLDYIHKYGGITQKQANAEIGVSRLSGRIWDLKAKGYPIYDEWITVRNRYGEKCRVKQYRFGRGQQDGNE